MNIARVPKNEEGRLVALSRYNIIDTLPEEDYDNITKLACLICNTPISAVSLIDSDRQFLKSVQGTDIGETPRDLSFCAHAINHPNEVLMIPDSRKDVRFADNPLVTGTPHVVFYSGVPLVTEDGYALGTLCVIDHKPNELNDDQQNALKSLGKQVIRLLELRLKNEQLEDSKQKLTLFAQDMENFAYIASHDLREPLRMVKSFIDLLSKKYGGDMDDMARKYMQFALDGASRMDVLINDLLDYFTAGTLSNEKEETDVNEILDDVKQLFALLLTEKSVVIHSNKLPTIKISKVAIRLILQNLIGNAIKYQLPENHPIIQINSSENSTHWKFSIQDNGIGISSENIESIFTIFKRLHRKDEYSGSGLGLSIVKRIVEQHGGTIHVESTKGAGSIFYFTLQK